MVRANSSLSYQCVGEELQMALELDQEIFASHEYGTFNGFSETVFTKLGMKLRKD